MAIKLSASEQKAISSRILRAFAKRFPNSHDSKSLHTAWPKPKPATAVIYMLLDQPAEFLANPDNVDLLLSLPEVLSTSELKIEPSELYGKVLGAVYKEETAKANAEKELEIGRMDDQGASDKTADVEFLRETTILETLVKSEDATTTDTINCVIVGMEGKPLVALLQQLRGDVNSPYTFMLKAAGREVSSALGPLPILDVQLVRKSGHKFNFDNVLEQLRDKGRNLICMGVDDTTYLPAYDFIKRLRAMSDKSLIAVVYSNDLPSEDLVALCRAGADRVISATEDPVVIEAMMLSLARNDMVRFSSSTVESFGPLHIVWDSTGNRSSRRMYKIYVQNDQGKRVDVHLTRKEITLLEKMAQKPGVVCTKEELLAYSYQGRDVPSIKIIDVFICKARDKINEALGQIDYNVSSTMDSPIMTVWGRGYLLNPNFGQNITQVVVRPEGTGDRSLSSSPAV